MKPVYQDNHVTQYCMDFRENDLPDECVQMVVTSPPYWGLRKYDGEQDLIWGGDRNCVHEWQPITKPASSGSNVNPGVSSKTQAAAATKTAQVSNTCPLCGAWRGAYGLEPTPDMYVQHTVEILREIKKVLRKDGVVFWNIGDSYAGSNMEHGTDKPTAKQASNKGTLPFMCRDGYKPHRLGGFLKPKDLCLIPFRVALAAQADGWWVRSDIIWSKPNPMPESATDRPTNSHEYIFMFTKSSKYYWDADAVREPYTEPMNRWGGDKLVANGVSTWDIGTGQASYRDRNMRPNDNGRNIRSVWDFPTQPYPEAHFAVFPEKLPETCIKAASRKGDTVLDPFAGSGTTLWVAKKLGRKAIGFDLSEKYCKLNRKRNQQQVFSV